MPLSSNIQKRLFILGSFVVLLLAVLLYWRINLLVDTYRQIDHTTQIETGLEHALSYLKDAETGQRGFLLTNDSIFLEPYLGARERIDSEMANVKQLTQNNIKQQQNFASLQMLIDQRFNLLSNTFLYRDTSSQTLHQYLRRGKLSMDRIRYQINQMEVAERNVLKEHDNEKNRYIRLTPLSLLFLVFAMLLIIGFSYHGLSRQLQQTRKAATDLDDLNRELQLKNKHLENSVEELNSFNYIASHDLKEPLRKILFFTDTLSSQKQAITDDGQSYLDKIHVAGERMKNLLDDLLTYSQASMMERKKEKIDLNAIVATVAESLSEQVKEKKATVRYNGLPHISAVPSQMQQLFENLISNSLKYSNKNRPPAINIQSRVCSRNSLPHAFETVHDYYHQIRFTDNGIGFTQENAEKIFELFQRLHQRHEFSGTGIGLTICRKIVQNHDGFITAESQVDNGTTFFIYLPA